MWSHLHKALFAPANSRSQTHFWFSLSLTFAAVYGLLALREAFSNPYIVQDDARQHVFWAQRFVDPALFPQDLIADYYRSLAPAGYAALYWAMAAVGISPELVSKVLPFFLGLATTAGCFAVSLELLPVPIAGFITSLLLNQNLWLKDDLASATPRAFLYPLFLAFLYCLMRRAVLPCLGVLVLLVLFYPNFMLIAAGVLLLQPLRWRSGQVRWSGNRQDALICLAGLAICCAGIVPYVLTSSAYGPAMTAAEARTMPEFLPGGRTQFFVTDPLQYWIWGSRGSLLPKALFTPVTVLAGLFLPGLLRLGDRLPLAKQVQAGIMLLPQVLLVSCGWFLLAHVVLFKLYLPSRYTWHSFCIVLVLAAGVTLTLILDALLRSAAQRLASPAKRSWLPASLALSVSVLIGVALVFYPSFVKKFPITYYLSGQAPALYQFFAQQPKDSLIASLSNEANNLPTFAHRPVLVSSEYALPYQVGYYRQIRQRAIDLIQAHYSSNAALVQAFTQQYNIRFWLLDQTAFEPGYLSTNRWLKQFQPATNEAVLHLQQGVTPVLKQIIPRCTAYKDDYFVVLPASCVSEALKG